MENINTDLGKDFDVSKLYIGIYESKDGERIGLFKKDSIRSTINGDRSYQFYKDILSDYYVAMSLDSQGNDRKAQYSVMTGDPEEKANWRGIVGTANLQDLLAVPFVQDIYPDNRLFEGFVVVDSIPNANMSIGEIDRGFGLIELSSAIPNLKANSSLVEMVEALISFYSKINLKDEVVKQLTENLKSVPTYFENKNEKMPTFFNASALELNEIDMSNIPEDFSTIKHR